MRKQNWLIIAAVALLVALPLWLAPRPLPGPDGQAVFAKYRYFATPEDAFAWVG